MPTMRVNGVDLFYERSGERGESLVLVHGSWTDHHSFDVAIPALASTCRVLTYDRRGHSQSERPVGQGSVREDVADLAALIEALDLAPAHIAGISFGARVALQLACARPDLVQSLALQEPPLLGLLGDDPATRPLMQGFHDSQRGVLERLREGDMAGGARQFVEEIAAGPGRWEQMPPRVQHTFVQNAPTFLDESDDPDAFTIELAQLSSFPNPVLLSEGDQSPPLFGPILERLARALPRARRHTFAGAGHNPLTTHRDDYTATLLAFIVGAEGA